MPDANPDPDPELVVTMFAELGIRRLAELIDAGDLSELGDHVQSYANMAASWSAPPLVVDGEELRDAVAQHFGYLVLQVLCGDGPDYVEHDGEPYLRDLEGGERAVTPELLAHYQRLWSLLCDDGAARAFLALVPDEVRAAAEGNAGRLWESSFDDIARRFED
jgi:hypothetical protein